MDFGYNLKMELKAQKKTAYALAKATGITKQTISLYLNNKAEPTISKLKLICEYLEVSADYLLDIKIL